MIERRRSLVPVEPHDVALAPQKDPDSQPPSKKSRRLALVLVAVVLLGLLGWGGWSRWQTHRAAIDAQQQQRDFVPEVRTAKATRIDGPIDLVEPGQTEAFDSARLFARATGYVAERKVDIGSRVHKGDLLLRIAAPDLDQQLAQARAQLGQTEAAILQAQANLRQAEATVNLANVTRQRTTTLANQGAETRQNADNASANALTGAAGVAIAQAGIEVARANQRAQQATLDRLQELVGFEQMTAPFDGVVTTRNVDTGDLLSANSAGGTPLLSLARDDRLRVGVYIPQSSAISLREGLQAKVTVPEMPGRTFDGVVSRTTASLDQASHSMLAEIDVANPDLTLRAGLYVQVTISIPREAPGIVVPSEALVFNAAGLQVAVLDGEHVHFHGVTIYRDFGTTVELRGVLNGGETILLSPPPNLGENDRVRVAADPKK
jgi:HlyD family secretion protein